MGMDLNDAKIM